MTYRPDQPKIVKKWSGGALQSVKNQYLSIVSLKTMSGDGFDSLKVAHKMEYGEVTRVSFKMARHLVWLHGGFGKGVGGSKGSSWLDKKGNRKKTNPQSLNAPKKNRRAKAWFVPVIERELPKLADELLKEKIDAAINAVGLT